MQEDDVNVDIFAQLLCVYHRLRHGTLHIMGVQYISFWHALLNIWNIVKCIIFQILLIITKSFEFKMLL